METSLDLPQGVRSYRQKELQVNACDWPKSKEIKLKAGLSTLRNWEPKQEGDDSQQICVDVVEGELHENRTSSVNTNSLD